MVTFIFWELNIIMQQQRPPPTEGTVYDEIPAPPVSDEIWKLILDRSSIPEVLVHTLKGEVWVTTIDPKTSRLTGRWERRGRAVMNEIGIRFFSPHIYSSMSPDKLATFFTDEEVKDRAREMAKTIILIIAERGDEFGVAASDRRYVVRLFDDFYFANLTASRKGTILNALRQIYERRETYVPEKKPKRGVGVFGR